ncbi:hypothetical protein ACFKJS_11150, partial [Streptococcus agalactiae]|uniref:hypothetical protein n=1 Tax=Streptococcus agalactiae TaxID=1311 RepID=UPI0036361406
MLAVDVKIAGEERFEGKKVVKVPTEGTIGIENQLTSEEIAAADIVLLAVDVKIAGEERFEGKKVVKVPTEGTIGIENQLTSEEIAAA